MEEKERFEEAKRLYKDANADQRYVLERLFPQLIESEGDKIRKEIIKYFKHYSGGDDVSIKFPEWIAWLEKQDEHASAWSEEDEKMFYIICNDIKYAQKNHYTSKLTKYGKKIDWLRTLKDKVQPQSKQEWGEKDNRLLNDAISLADECDDFELRDWLKSLKERYTWKPSEEQVEALKHYVDTTMDGEIDLLYQDLTKLMEE